MVHMHTKLEAPQPCVPYLNYHIRLLSQMTKRHFGTPITHAIVRDKQENTGKRPKGRGMIIPMPWSLTAPPMADNG